MRSHAYRLAAVLCAGSLALACAKGSEGTDASSGIDAAALPDGSPQPDAPVLEASKMGKVLGQIACFDGV